MATVKVLIPTPLRKFTGDQETVSVEDASSIAELMTSLTQAHSGLAKPLLDAGERLLLVGSPRDLRFLRARLATAVGREVAEVASWADACAAPAATHSGAERPRRSSACAIAAKFLFALGLLTASTKGMPRRS